MSDLYEEDLQFERDLRYIPNLNEITKGLISFSSRSTKIRLDISEQAIIDEFFSNSKSEEEKATTPNSLNIREEESNINISPLNDKRYLTEKIIKILKENNIPQYIIDKIELSEITYKDIEIIMNPIKTFITKKKRKKTKKTEVNIEKENLPKGRNAKDDNTIRKHNKDSSDNIARKIKVYIFKVLIEYCKINVSKDLLGLDYEYISNLKKDTNIKMLDSSLKEILSLDTSSKFGKDNRENNKKIISAILEKESNNEKVKALLDMKFNDWIDNILLFKENTKDTDKFNGLESILSDLISKLQFPRDNYYLTRFLFYLFNFRSWFENKKGRNENN